MTENKEPKNLEVRCLHQTFRPKEDIYISWVNPKCGECAKKGPTEGDKECLKYVPIAIYTVKVKVSPPRRKSHTS